MDTLPIKNLVEKIASTELMPAAVPNIDNGERALSVLAGSYLLYKSLRNIVKHPLLGFQGVAAGGLLIYRGATGVCPLYQRLGIDTTDTQAINISETITVNAPRETVYAFWRELSNLPKFMDHLKEVTELGEKTSHWTANTPGGIVPLSWNAEITHEESGKYLGWQSTAGSMIENAGKVEFTDTLNTIGTQLHVEINYFPPAGSVGRGIASLFTGLFEKMIRDDIQQFKQYAEQEEFKHYAGLSELS
ncbi:MAG: DUF2892 domain-containing protein [Chitinophagaceae bacterium]|nr:MAG: DUF2892 domain-containing protein [Chitinophagaceae bacterium]